MATHWIVFLVSVLPLWLLQNVIHELAHGITLWAGWKWKFKIWPFPSKKLGRFTFAHVKYEKTAESKEVSDKGWALVSIMPRIVNIVFILLALIPCFLISSKSIVIPFLIFMWTNLIDMCVGLLAIFKEPNLTDIWKFQKRLDFPVPELKKICVFTGVFFILVVAIVSIFSLV